MSHREEHLILKIADERAPICDQRPLARPSPMPLGKDKPVYRTPFVTSAALNVHARFQGVRVNLRQALGCRSYHLKNTSCFRR